MRLINVETHELHDFQARPPAYAILSHRWEGDEITYAQYMDKNYMQEYRYSTRSWEKTRGFCDLVLDRWEDSIKWVWVDTCCINKSSSAELSESINSMFKWYEKSVICVLFLSDVEGTTLHEFVGSQWFTRGWTLQELLAPNRIEFYNSSWKFIGTRQNLCRDLSRRTGIPVSILYNPRKYRIEWTSVAQRMSWASTRYTTRGEDQAYCLLGVFGVNMPLIYGEGSYKAFQRLQLEIINQIDKESIFAWDETVRFYSNGSILAKSPFDFYMSSDVRKLCIKDLRLGPVARTNMGLHLRRTLWPMTGNHQCLKHVSLGAHPDQNSSYMIMPIMCTLNSQPLALSLLLVDVETMTYVRGGMFILERQLSSAVQQDFFMQIVVENTAPIRATRHQDFPSEMLTRLEQDLKRDIVNLPASQSGNESADFINALTFSLLVGVRNKTQSEAAAGGIEFSIVTRVSELDPSLNCGYTPSPIPKTKPPSIPEVTKIPFPTYLQMLSLSLS